MTFLGRFHGESAGVVYRLGQEPRRLWRRFILQNGHYVCLLLLQLLKIRRPKPLGSESRL